MERNIFGKRIHQYRFDHDLTQEQLGKLIGVSKQTISVWEKGTSSPALQTIFDISEKMHVPVNYLLGVTSDAAFSPVAGASPERQFLMDKARTATDEDIARLKQIWDLIDKESDN